VYIPSALLVVGAAVFKSEWLPFAVAIAAVLAGVKLFNGNGRM
jgi:cytochrome-b5 reductase